MPTNGRIIVTGTGDSAREIFMIRFYQPMLVSREDTVPLRAGLAETAPRAETQTILIPQRSLIPGREYRLSVEKDGSALEGLRWKTEEEPDTIPPQWNGPPVRIGGCDREGESRYVYIALPIDEEADRLVIEAELVEEKESEENEKQQDTLRTRLFPRKEIIERFDRSILVSDKVVLKLDYSPDGQLVSVPDHLILPLGDGIYGGGIKLKEGKSYRLRMTALDIAGNRSTESFTGRIRVPEGTTTQQATPGGSGMEEKTPPGASIPEFENTE